MSEKSEKKRVRNREKFLKEVKTEVRPIIEEFSRSSGKKIKQQGISKICREIARQHYFSFVDNRRTKNDVKLDTKKPK